MTLTPFTMYHIDSPDNKNIHSCRSVLAVSAHSIALFLFTGSPRIDTESSAQANTQVTGSLYGQFHTQTLTSLLSLPGGVSFP